MTTTYTYTYTGAPGAVQLASGVIVEAKDGQTVEADEAQNSPSLTPKNDAAKKAAAALAKERDQDAGPAESEPEAEPAPAAAKKES